MAQKSTTSSKTFRISRDSKTGQFVPVGEVKRRPNTTTVERMPKSGYGTLKRDVGNGRYVEEKHRVSGKSLDTISKTTKKRSSTLKNLAQK